MDFAEWAVARWNDLIPDIQADTAVLGIRFERLSRAHHEQLSRALRPFHQYGIKSLDDFRTVALVRRLGPQGATVSDIAEQLGATRGAVSNRIDRLELEEIFARVPNKRDRRSHAIVLNERGESLADEMATEVFLRHQEYFSVLTAKETAVLSTLLAKLGATRSEDFR